jgi:hypothetical protein
MTMKDNKYKLLSENEKPVKVPERSIKIADNLINDLKNLEDRSEVINILHKYIYAWDAPINNAAHNLYGSKPESPEYKEASDKLHVLIGMRVIDEDTKVGYIKINEECNNKKIRLQNKNDKMYNNLVSCLGKLEGRK